MNTTTNANTTKIDNASKALEKCSNLKCDNIISKQNLDHLGLKHMDEVKGNCNGFSDKECVDKIKKEDKFGYTKLFDARKSCVDKECSKEATEFDKLLFPSRFKKNTKGKKRKQKKTTNRKSKHKKHKKSKTINKYNNKKYSESRLQIGGEGQSLLISYGERQINNNELLPSTFDYSKAPTITIDNAINGASNSASNDNIYLITMTDPDAPNREDGEDMNGKIIYTHWVFTRKANDDNTYNEIVSYAPPSPPKGSGTHHYQFNLYDISMIDTNELNILKVDNNLDRKKYFENILKSFIQNNIIKLLSSFQFIINNN